MNEIKLDFPILDKKIRDNNITYLDSAASTQKPRQVIQSISDFLENSYENVHRGMNSLSIDATDLYEKSRDVAKKFINANSPNEIIFTRGATDSINIIANSLAEQLKEGDKIIVTELEHHSNYLPWMNLCKKLGLELEIIPISNEGILSEDDIINSCDNTTKVLSLTHMSNVTGQILDIKKIKKEIDDKILVAVDGCQSIAHLKIDVKDLDCDFYSFSSHKLYGPSGIGIMYGKEHILEQLNPPTLLSLIHI